MASAAMMASAETVTFDVSGENGYGMTLLSGSTSEYNADGTTLTEGAVTITLHGNTRWWANSNGNQLRFYKESGMTVNAGGANISKIEFTPNNIKLGGDGFASGVWSGNATEVTLNATNTSGNTYCNKITVTYGEGGDTPNPESQYGKYEAATTFAPGDYLIYSSEKIAVPLSGTYGYIQVDNATVTDGTIVALKANQFKFVADGEYYNIIDSQNRYVYQTGTYNSFNVAAEKPEEGAQWSVTANADGTFSITNVAKQKTIQYDTQYNSFGCYDDERGLKPSLYRYVADAVNTEPEPELPIIEDLISLSDFPNNERFIMNAHLSVVYANGAYTYVYDGMSYGLIYKAGLYVTSGNIIGPGWTGKVSIYNGLLELIPDEAPLSLVTGMDYNLPSPIPVEAEDAPYMVAAYNQSRYVKLLNVVFDNATPAADVTSTADRTYTGKMGDFEVTFFQRFGLESVEPGTYDVTGFIAVYNDLVQVYPIAIETPGGTVEPELPVIENLIVLSDFPNNEAFEMGIDLTVVYANGSYVYVNDGQTYGLIYKNGLGLEAGNVIAKGWKGKVSIYNGLLELVPDDATLSTTGAAEVPAPLPVEAEDASYTIAPYNQSLYVKLLNVTFENATPAPDAAGADRTYTGKMGENEVTFYQRFGLESVEAGTYDVTGFIAVYNDLVQVYPVAIQAAGEVEPELPVIESLNIISDIPDKEAFEMGIDLTVVYANGAYTYVYDGVSYALIYKNGLGLEAGNVIAKGWKGKVSIYNGLVELVPDDATLATTGENSDVPSPMSVEGEDAEWVVAAYNQNAYVKLENVVFETATPAADAAGAARTYTGKMGEFEVTFYQRFGLDSVEAGAYDVTGFIAVYNDQVQVYPILFQGSSGISAIANDDADARYYNINGVEVSNPAQGGLYIRVAGGKATKVIK